jgi:iron complex transport system substrate-binding protein
MTCFRTLIHAWLFVVLLGLAACGGTNGPAPANTVTTTGAIATIASTGAASNAPASVASATTRLAVNGTATRVATVPSNVPGSATRAAPGGATPSAGASPGATIYPLAIRDVAGRTVTIARRPRRIVSLAPSNTETLFALGLGERVVGVDQSSDYPAAARDKPRIGTFSQPTIEQVAAQSPDLILAANIHVRSAVPALEALGLAVVVLNPADLPQVLDSITLVGQLTDSQAAAKGLRDGLEARIAAVSAKVAATPARPRTYVEITSKLVAAGPTSYIGDLIVRAGGANIVDDRATQYPALGPETIIARDPEVIVLTDAGAEVTGSLVGARPGWAGISAVKGGRVVAIDPNLLNRAGPRVVDGLEALAAALHPELFGYRADFGPDLEPAHTTTATGWRRPSGGLAALGALG